MDGTCKLSLYCLRKREDEESSITKFLQITSQGELLNSKQVISEGQKSKLREIIFINSADDELFVQIIKTEDENEKSVKHHAYSQNCP